MRRVAATILIASAGSLAAPSVAGATIYESGDYAGTDVEEFEACGLDIHYEVEFSGHYRVREGKNRDAGTFFLQDNYSAVETYTNTANGKFMTISHDGVFQDLRATHVEGSVFEFVSHEVGQPYVVRDMDGNVVLRDRGALTFEYLFDTLGDDMPGGEWVSEPDVRVSGPHPGWFLTPEEQCAGLNNLIG